MYIRFFGSFTCIAGNCSLRLTLSEETTKEDADYVVDNLKMIVERLRSMSPLYDDFVKKESEGK